MARLHRKKSASPGIYKILKPGLLKSCAYGNSRHGVTAYDPFVIGHLILTIASTRPLGLFDKPIRDKAELTVVYVRLPLYKIAYIQDSL